MRLNPPAETGIVVTAAQTAEVPQHEVVSIARRSVDAK